MSLNNAGGVAGNLRRFVLGSTSLLAVGAALAPVAAVAQDDEILVTGSRIARSTFTSSSPLTVVGSEQIEALGQINAAETLKIIPQNAAFQSTTNVGLQTPQQGGNVGVESANLRGLNPSTGGARTLVMVDTKRFVPTTPGGNVDLNQIPSLLIASTEVVTGGASAQYGTDAVAGVVNIILDKTLVGLKGQIDYGQTFHGDTENWHAALAAGSEFANGRGHIIIGGEYSTNEGSGDCADIRQWCIESWDTVNNADDPTLPRTLILNDVKTAQYSLQGTLRNRVDEDTGMIAPGGAITNITRRNTTPVQATFFSDDGKSLREYDPGNFAALFGTAQGGSGGESVRIGSETYLDIPLDRTSLLGRVQYDVTDNMTAYFEANYATRESEYLGNSQGPQSTFNMTTANAYLQCANYNELSQAQRAVGVRYDPGNCEPVTILALPGQPIQANAIGQFIPGLYAGGEVGGVLATAKEVPIVDMPSRLGDVMNAEASQILRSDDGMGGLIDPTIGLLTWAKHMENAARPQNLSSAETYRFTAGVEGEIAGNWNWDVYYQYGHSEQIEDLKDTRTNNFFRAALDAVFLDDGSITCNVLVDPNHPQFGDPLYDDCAPINLIGLSESDGRLTDEARAFVYRTQENDFEYKQQVFGGNINGELFNGFGAGPIGAAAGFELRREEGNVTHGTPFPEYYGNFSRPQIGFPYSGELEVNEIYGELAVPLLRDFPMAKYLEVGGAYRQTWQTNSDTSVPVDPNAQQDIYLNSKDTDYPSWKVNIDWQIVDWLRFRGTQSRDVRAAGFRDLYFKGTLIDYGTTEARLNNPWVEAASGGVPGGPDGTGPQGDWLDFTRSQTTGSFELEPEEGDTTTLGVVFTPGWGLLDGLQVSADWYEIDLQQAISAVSLQNVVDLCFEQGAFCGAILEDQGGNDTGPFTPINPNTTVTDIGQVLSIPINVGQFLQKGWDFEVLYDLPLDRVMDNWVGNLSLRSIYTYVYTFKVLPDAERGCTTTVAGGPFDCDYAGSLDSGATFGDFQPAPEWRSNHWLTYSVGGFQTTFGVRYIGEVLRDITLVGPEDARFADAIAANSSDTVNINQIGSHTVYSLSASYEFNPFENSDASTEVFLAMDNIFDSDPPITPSRLNYSTEPTFYDTLGARFRAGLRFRY